MQHEVPDHQHLTRDELMRLASERAVLTEEAQLALDAEISDRRITSLEISSFKAESLAAQAEQDRQVGSVATSSSYVGKRFFGRKNLTHDSRSRIADYDTTLWFFTFWFPIVPLGTYRIRRLYYRRWSFYTSDVFHVLQKRPQRDWEQILLTWIKATLVLLFLRFAVPFVLHYFVYR
jgi:hypothetical protein